jgi:Catalase
MPRDGYLRYAPSIEQPRPDEPETIKTIVASIERTNASSFAGRSHAIRQQHAKGQGFLKGELTVYDDLPDHLRQGIFATASRYPIIVRLSTAFGDIRSDRIRVPRGMAIKVLGVSGPKALPEDDSTNQDFLLVNHKSYFSDAAAYLSAQRSFELQPSTPDLVLRAAGLAARSALKLSNCTGLPVPMVLNAIGDAGNNILGESFYSEGAIRFGDYVAKLCAAPVSEAVLGLKGQPGYKDDNTLLDSVVAFFLKNSAEYELRAQLCTDLRRTPVEDASIDWPEELSPHQPLGKITLPPQAANSPARRAYADDVLSFDPWRCLADHRPLGSIMRLRQEAYRASRTFRHEKNKQPMNEPKQIVELPD